MKNQVYDPNIFEALISLSHLGTWVWRVDTGDFSLNDTLLKALDRDPSEFDGKIETFNRWIHPDDQSSIKQAIDYLLNDGLPFSIRIRVQKKDGTFGFFDSQAQRVQGKNNNEWYLVGVVTGDGLRVNEAVELENILVENQKMIMHASRMSALGEMAGGMAHEINNPLTVIQTKAIRLKKMIEAGKSKPDQVTHDLDRIAANCTRIAKIIKGLSAFSRSSENDPFLPTKLSTIIEDTLELCHERIKSRDISFEIGKIPDVEIECRQSQISQVLLNLIKNAQDAVENLREKWIRLEFKQDRDAVFISLTDSGEGVPSLLAEKIMQPFFTTKGVGKGTGLGLSIAQGITDAHRGTLTLDKKSPNTKFILKLPIRLK